ncbi:protein of unknown function [Nitrospira japonica]|uniref:Uncharacterized protein n=1 Tax=Nitrospira japonica TaxID=1325564 RepID=A0A1W1I0V0_9BACT|nr:protein of unknown function [Nitrospira japonica]
MPLQILVRGVVQIDAGLLRPLDERPFPFVPSGIAVVTTRDAGFSAVVGGEKAHWQRPEKGRDTRLIIEASTGRAKCVPLSSTVIVVGKIGVRRQDQEYPGLGGRTWRAHDEEAFPVAIGSVHGHVIEAGLPFGRHVKRQSTASLAVPPAAGFGRIGRNGLWLHPDRPRPDHFPSRPKSVDCKHRSDPALGRHEEGHPFTGFITSPAGVPLDERTASVHPGDRGTCGGLRRFGAGSEDRRSRERQAGQAEAGREKLAPTPPLAGHDGRCPDEAMGIESIVLCLPPVDPPFADTQMHGSDVEFLFQLVEHVVADRPVVAQIDQGHSLCRQDFMVETLKGFDRIARPLHA